MSQFDNLREEADGQLSERGDRVDRDRDEIASDDASEELASEDLVSEDGPASEGGFGSEPVSDSPESGRTRAEDEESNL